MPVEKLTVLFLKFNRKASIVITAFKTNFLHVSTGVYDSYSLMTSYN